MLAPIPWAGSKASPAQLTATCEAAPFWRGRGFVEQGPGSAMWHWCCRVPTSCCQDLTPASLTLLPVRIHFTEEKGAQHPVSD